MALCRDTEQKKSGALALSLGEDFAEHLLATGRDVPVQHVLVADAGFNNAHVLEYGQAIADQFSAQPGLVGEAHEIAVNVIFFGNRTQDLDIVIGQRLLGWLWLALMFTLSVGAVSLIRRQFFSSNDRSMK